MLEDGYIKRKSLKLGLTPLIDMVFLLLIFFMLTTSFENKMGVEMSSSQGGGSSVSKPIQKNIIITLQADGRVVVNNQLTNIYDFSDIIKAIFKQDKSQQIFIKLDDSEDTPPNVQDAVNLITKLRDLSISNISFLESES